MLFLILSLSGYAQEGLHINDIFENIGKQKGTLIRLGTRVLSPQTNIVLYQSLQIKADTEILEAIECALAKDTEAAKILLSSDQNETESKTIHYELPQNPRTVFREYILFNYNKGHVSLVYLKGDFPPGKLREELNKLKDLFIKLK